MSEHMAYKFKGSGFEAPEEKRKYKEPDLKARKKFEAMLDSLGKIDEKFQASTLLAEEKLLEAQLEGDFLIKRYIDTNKITLVEGHGLILQYQGKSKYLGYFLHVLHNQCEDKTIIYDLDADVEFVGGRLRQDKRLISRANVHDIGEYAEGAIINYGEAYSGCRDSRGLLINAGAIKYMGTENKALLINFGEVESIALQAKASCRIINAGSVKESLYYAETDKIIDYTGLQNAVITQTYPPLVLDKKTKHAIKTQIVTNPEFNKFIEDLRQKVEAGRKDNGEAIKLANSLDQEIKNLDQILKEAGHEWWFK